MKGDTRTRDRPPSFYMKKKVKFFIHMDVNNFFVSINYIFFAKSFSVTNPMSNVMEL